MAVQKMTLGRPLSFSLPVASFRFGDKTYPGPEEQGMFKSLEVGFHSAQIGRHLHELMGFCAKSAKISDITVKIGGTTFRFKDCFIADVAYQGPVTNTVFAYQDAHG